MSKSEGERFGYYAEANVDAPKIWPVFRDLCQALLAPEATLVFCEIDDDPRPLRSAPLVDILNALARYAYQLVHDGYIQFGVVCEDTGAPNEVFVAPTKHLKIWLNDQVRFRSVMASHGIPEVHRLEFLDEHPRTTVKLPPATGALQYTAELAKRLETDIDAPRDNGEIHRTSNKGQR